MPPSCTTAADSLVSFSHPVSPYKITLSQEQFSKQQVLPRSQQSSPPHSWCKQPSVYCLSTSSMGHCLPPPCSSQSISRAVFPKDYISGRGWEVERDTLQDLLLPSLEQLGLFTQVSCINPSNMLQANWPDKLWLKTDLVLSLLVLAPNLPSILNFKILIFHTQFY